MQTRPVAFLCVSTVACPLCAEKAKSPQKMSCLAPSSTFGWWLGYLSKGQSVYYQDIRSTNDVNYKKGHMDPDDYFPPRWTSINLDGTSGEIVVVGKTS
uniref:Uncharacterized protein n=2 Tax=Caenorhabditis japonica TaxID=281687 RepID=A0A8R1HXZ8_CAEJA